MKNTRYKDYLKDWKRESGIRKWEDFFRDEYRPKHKRLNDALNSILAALSFDSRDKLSHSANEGFSSLLTAGHCDKDGNKSFTYQKLVYNVDLNALVHHFEHEFHRIVNEEFSQLSDLAFKWDAIKCYYGQSEERCSALGLLV